jgi:hypothetical protein
MGVPGLRVHVSIQSTMMPRKGIKIGDTTSISLVSKITEGKMKITKTRTNKALDLKGLEKTWVPMLKADQKTT